MFETILIANRGEIACRVIRTARHMGIRTVAVFSEADRDALHVRAANVAIPIGRAPAVESYLCGERILEAARRTAAEAIHPGYGFLSENADFAEACVGAGIEFIGPPADAIRTMGLKDAAKLRMEEAGVPVVPGYHGTTQDSAELLRRAERIGFPVLIKAIAGGGGKGMRRVESAADFDAALAIAQREAESAFGDARVLIEKYLTTPRHIEIQVFADAHGNTLHLFERDCSLQRRHQKVIEEAPGPGVAPAMRGAMGEAAVQAAKAIGYRGAGTVEFIVDVANGLTEAPFYFMEMNTRLQVEHAVTEAVTGADLVEWQLRVAAGEPLPCSQSDLVLAGHAIEARVYAEDPARGYLPQTGKLVRLRPPLEDEHVRVDIGVAEGDRVSVYYDPMIAKLIVHDRDRDSALRRLRRALEGFELVGPNTNLALLRAVAAHAAFARAELDTGFLERHADALLANANDAPTELVALACLGLLQARAVSARAEAREDRWSPWAETDAFRLNEDGFDLFHLRCGKRDLEVAIHFRSDALTLAWEEHSLLARDISLQGDRVSATIDDVRHSGVFVDDGSSLHILQAGRHLQLARVSETAGLDEEAANGGAVRAPMPGKIIDVLVAEGDRVRRGQPLIRLEAMKMEHTLCATGDGVVEQLSARPGDQVEEGAVLLAVG